MFKKRSIAVVTGSRAEFGLLKPVLQKIKDDEQLELKLYVTGMHIEGRFGRTVTEITAAGFDISKQVDIFLQDDTPRGVSRSTALSMMGFADIFATDRPDVLLVLCDRFEIFGAVSAACVHGIPVAHIHGGELTEGVMDEQFRHCITKMSHIHFTATDEYRNRVIQMGEQPDRVFNTGSPAVDAILAVDLISKDQLESELGLRFKEKNLLITFHPVILDEMSPKEQFVEMLKALDATEAYLIFTYANADTGGTEINKLIEDYVSANQERAYVTKSFGHQRYLSVLNQCTGMVGNSSSGILEAAVCKKGAVNIGIRQKGRVRGDNVIDCGISAREIALAITKLESESFQTSLTDLELPYGDGKSAERIVAILKEIELGGISIKKFNDLEMK
ncbi:MAG: UDP-N-acetylglucosamine 2-epimerase (hydrolyzing) [Denitrovibrio sp.]|nr:MAG: UDP-N-acetylglucosamine 2-epimerase (hydrolyzing) [Denitrovibrio sp.]